MATITATDMRAAGSIAATVTTLTASDDFTYNSSRKPVLVLNNVTGGALTPNIDGDGGSTVRVGGVGDVDVSSGYTFPSIAAGATATIQLGTIAEYLKGTIAVTGGTGIEAMLLEF